MKILARFKLLPVALVLLALSCARPAFSQTTCEDDKVEAGKIITGPHLITVSRGGVLITYRYVPKPGGSGYGYQVDAGGAPALDNPGPTIPADNEQDFLSKIGCPPSSGSTQPTSVRPRFRAARPSPAKALDALSLPAPPASGQAAQSIAFGFFNADTVLDTAVVTPRAGITVNLFQADGTLLSSQKYALNLVEVGIVAADFNGDGNVDLAAIQDPDSSGQGHVAILLGHGDGTFGSPTNFAAGPGPLSIAIGDFNGDGRIDLAVGNSPTTGLNGVVSILLGKGDGTFAPAVAYNVNQEPESLLAVDLNNDGKLDLAMINSGPGSVDEVQILLGNGDGTFQPGAEFSTGTGLGYLAYTDLNHDGKIDLLIVDPASSAVATFFGMGDSTFASPQFSIGAAGASSLALMPLEDGNTAILLPDNITGNLILTFAGPDGVMEGPALQTLGIQPNAITAADLNGNKQPDLVIADPQAGSLYVLLNAGSGQFSKPTTYPVGPSPASVAVADLNQDGKPDVIAADSGGIDVLLGNGDGTLGTLETFSSSAGQLNSLTLADFHGTGNLDVASANTTAGAGIALFAANGDGTFQPATTIPIPGGVVVFALVSGDFNGDGKPDLAVIYNPPLPSGVSFSLPPGGIDVLLGTGGGAFAAAINIPLSGAAISLGAGDVNGDGKLDLIAAFQGTNGHQVVSLLGQGDGTFKPATAASTLTSAATIVVVDINGDGKPDLLLGDCCGLAEASYLLGNGDGTYQPELQFPSGPSPAAIAAADFNGDGKLDLAIAGGIQMPLSGTLAILINASTATNAATIVSSANSNAAGVAPGSLASVYGTNLATSVVDDTALPLPAQLGGTSLSIVDAAGTTTPAPLLYVSPAQVNFEVPSGVATGPATATITAADGTVSVASLQIAAVAPGIFELNSAGLVAAYATIYAPNGTQTPEMVYTITSAGTIMANPISLGTGADQAYLFLFGTGLQAAGTAGVKVTINGIDVPVQFAGPQRSFVGLDQVNVLLPASLQGAGNVSIQVTANGLAANPVNVTIQ